MEKIYLFSFNFKHHIYTVFVSYSTLLQGFLPLNPQHLTGVRWFAVYVEPYTDLKMNDEIRHQLETNLQLAEELGGNIIHLKSSVAKEIVSFADQTI